MRSQEGASLSPLLQEGGRESQRDRAAQVPVNYTITLLCRTSCKISWRLTHGLGKRNKKKKTLVLLAKKCSPNNFLRYCWDAKHCQHKTQRTVASRASPLYVPSAASMVSRGLCLHVSGGIPPREGVLTGTASPLQQGLNSPISARDPALPPAAP